jgi:hypothetical protein
LLRTKCASDDEYQRWEVEQANSTEQRVRGGRTYEDKSSDEDPSPAGPADNGNTADECRSDDDDRFRLLMRSTRATSARLSPMAIQPPAFTSLIAGSDPGFYGLFRRRSRAAVKTFET